MSFVVEYAVITGVSSIPSKSNGPHNGFDLKRCNLQGYDETNHEAIFKTGSEFAWAQKFHGPKKNKQTNKQQCYLLCLRSDTFSLIDRELLSFYPIIQFWATITGLRSPKFKNLKKDR